MRSTAAVTAETPGPIFVVLVSIISSLGDVSRVVYETLAREVRKDSGITYVLVHDDARKSIQVHEDSTQSDMTRGVDVSVRQPGVLLEREDLVERLDLSDSSSNKMPATYHRMKAVAHLFGRKITLAGGGRQATLDTSGDLWGIALPLESLDPRDGQALVSQLTEDSIGASGGGYAKMPGTSCQSP